MGPTPPPPEGKTRRNRLKTCNEGGGGQLTASGTRVSKPAYPEERIRTGSALGDINYMHFLPFFLISMNHKPLRYKIFPFFVLLTLCILVLILFQEQTQEAILKDSHLNPFLTLPIRTYEPSVRTFTRLSMSIASVYFLTPLSFFLMCMLFFIESGD